MASIVIVTSQCYLLAEAINYIVINEVDDSNDKEWRPRTVKARKMHGNNKVQREYIMERKPFHVVIDFVPKGTPQTAPKQSSSDESSVVTVTVQGLRRTLKVFQDIVTQLREQIPDELFLDRLVERFLADVDGGGGNDQETIDGVGLK
jgi:hypothetical protein